MSKKKDPVLLNIKVSNILIEHTAFSSSSRKLKMFCCWTSALFFRDDVNDWGAHPASHNRSLSIFLSIFNIQNM